MATQSRSNSPERARFEMDVVEGKYDGKLSQMTTPRSLMRSAAMASSLPGTGTACSQPIATLSDINLEELSRGRGDWQNIQEIVRLALRAICSTFVQYQAQSKTAAQQSNVLRRQIRSKAERDALDALRESVESGSSRISCLEHEIDEMRVTLAAKADAQSVDEALLAKANRAAAAAAVAPASPRHDLESSIHVSPPPVRHNDLIGIDRRVRELETRMGSSASARAVDSHDSDATAHASVQQRLDRQDAVLGELTVALRGAVAEHAAQQHRAEQAEARLASAEQALQAISAQLAAKADAEHVEKLASSVASKESVAAALHRKANKTTCEKELVSVHQVLATHERALLEARWQLDTCAAGGMADAAWPPASSSAMPVPKWPQMPQASEKAGAEADADADTNPIDAASQRSRSRARRSASGVQTRKGNLQRGHNRSRSLGTVGNSSNSDSSANDCEDAPESLAPAPASKLPTVPAASASDERLGRELDAARQQAAALQLEWVRAELQRQRSAIRSLVESFGSEMPARIEALEMRIGTAVPSSSPSSQSPRRQPPGSPLRSQRTAPGCALVSRDEMLQMLETQNAATSEVEASMEALRSDLDRMIKEQLRQQKANADRASAVDVEARNAAGEQREARERIEALERASGASTRALENAVSRSQAQERALQLLARANKKGLGAVRAELATVKAGGTKAAEAARIAATAAGALNARVEEAERRATAHASAAAVTHQTLDAIQRQLSADADAEHSERQRLAEAIEATSKQVLAQGQRLDQCARAADDAMRNSQLALSHLGARQGDAAVAPPPVCVDSGGGGSGGVREGSDGGDGVGDGGDSKSSGGATQAGMVLPSGYNGRDAGVRGSIAGPVAASDAFGSNALPLTPVTQNMRGGGDLETVSEVTSVTSSSTHTGSVMSAASAPAVSLSPPNSPPRRRSEGAASARLSTRATEAQKHMTSRAAALERLRRNKAEQRKRLTTRLGLNVVRAGGTVADPHAGNVDTESDTSDPQARSPSKSTESQ